MAHPIRGRPEPDLWAFAVLTSDRFCFLRSDTVYLYLETYLLRGWLLKITIFYSLREVPNGWRARFRTIESWRRPSIYIRTPRFNYAFGKRISDQENRPSLFNVVTISSSSNSELLHQRSKPNQQKHPLSAPGPTLTPKLTLPAPGWLTYY